MATEAEAKVPDRATDAQQDVTQTREEPSAATREPHMAEAMPAVDTASEGEVPQGVETSASEGGVDENLDVVRMGGVGWLVCCVDCGVGELGLAERRGGFGV